MILSSQIKNFIRVHSLEVFPEECCGVVIKKQSGEIRPIRCDNKALDRLNFFKISPLDYIRASKEGQIVASYHSHPRDNQDKFSEFDKQASSNFRLNYILYVVRSDSFLEFDPNSKYNGYVGKIFFCGKNDCYSLVKSFYKNELDIDIPDFIPNRRSNELIITSHKYGELIENHCEENGWKKLSSFEELRAYDSICFDYQRKGITDHIGIYLGNNLILHHPSESYSCVEQINPKSLKFFRMILRREGLT